MKSKILLLVLFYFLLAGCKTKPTYTDNGNPGALKVTVFYDDNKNGTMDSSETGVPVEAGISQDISCPPSSSDKNTFSRTDVDSTALFENLKPGKYCVGLNGNYSNTTKATLEVYVSSDLRTIVSFGIARDQ